MWFRSRKPGDADRSTPGSVTTFADEVREALQLARELAARANATIVTPEVLLLALVTRDRFESCRVLAGLDLRPADISRELSRALKVGVKNPATTYSHDLPYSGGSKRVLEGAMRVAGELGQQVSTGHLLWAIAEVGSAASKLLRSRGASPDQIRARLKREAAPEVQLDINIDDNSDKQIYDQIVSQIREAVATSRLKPGDRLPAIRRLADQLGIAPGTVARAYAELETAQVIITDGPKGTYVAEPPLPTPPSVRPIAMRDLFRPVVVAAFHLGASAGELRKALEEAMTDIYPSGEKPAT